MADIPNTAEVAGIERDLQAFYSHVCNISRRTKAPDTWGGETETSSVIATGVKCDVQATVQTLRTTQILGEQIESRQNFTVSLPPETDIKIHDRLTITSMTPNQEYVVAAVLAPESWQFEKQVICTLEGEPLV